MRRAGLQWQLGTWGRDRPLPSVLMLSQALILLSARGEISDLRRQAAEEPEDERPAPVTQPVREEPQPAPVTAGADNGVTARPDPSQTPAATPSAGRSTSETPPNIPSPTRSCQFSAAELTDAPDPDSAQPQRGLYPAVDDGIVWSGDHRTTRIPGTTWFAWATQPGGVAQAYLVLHDRTLYDYPEYAGAYDRSLAGIDRYLKEYPSIRFVLDVHRDAIEASDGSQVKVVSEIEGQGTAAQLSLIMGSDGGGLSHPTGWRICGWRWRCRSRR